MKTDRSMEDLADTHLPLALYPCYITAVELSQNSTGLHIPGGRYQGTDKDKSSEKHKSIASKCKQVMTHHAAFQIAVAVVHLHLIDRDGISVFDPNFDRFCRHGRKEDKWIGDEARSSPGHKHSRHRALGRVVQL